MLAENDEVGPAEPGDADSDNPESDDEDQSDKPCDQSLRGSLTSLEDDQKTVTKKLRTQYPTVRERAWSVSFPRKWDKGNGSSVLSVTSHGLRLSYHEGTETARDKKDSASIKTDSPIPTTCGIYYFEITVVKADKGQLGIGLTKKDGPTNRMPGWDRNSFGYHGDDGHFFSSSGNGVEYGPSFGTGDVVGCGLNSHARSVFFTKNGKNLGIATVCSKNVSGFFPTVGLQMPDVIIEANFGHKEFAYDIDSHRKISQQQNIEVIERVPLPDDMKNWIDGTISSFLSYEGGVKTLKLFNETVAATYDEKLNSIYIRTKIHKYIERGSKYEKINALIRQYFPNLRKQDDNVRLLLFCYRFAETAAELARIQRSHTKPKRERKGKLVKNGFVKNGISNEKTKDSNTNGKQIEKQNEEAVGSEKNGSEISSINGSNQKEKDNGNESATTPTITPAEPEKPRKNKTRKMLKLLGREDELKRLDEEARQAALFDPSAFVAPSCAPSTSKVSEIDEVKKSLVSNPHKRGRSKEETFRRDKLDASPARKSPAVTRRHAEKCKNTGTGTPSKNGRSPKKTFRSGQESATGAVQDGEDFDADAFRERMTELISFGGTIFRFASQITGLKDETREIVEISLCSLAQLRPPKKVLNVEQRQYIAKCVSAAIHEMYGRAPHSQLTGLFLGWRGLRDRMGVYRVPAAAFTGIRTMLKMELPPEEKEKVDTVEPTNDTNGVAMQE
ncbi:unnamed protein product [Caenorhabditis auriculariae]|uniref:B30.2/SPRY domain-containing protein n=1 Tax=Caenorhabditis auriculariae TaxID=2777116 RepID=A0A8S1H6P9_9PELO|nr:unnamed protein product [Caenorhabditis auriculariae]